MLNPISLAFKNAKKENRPALLTYTVAGDSSKKQSLEILKAISNYADILEVGIPHNTPVAEEKEQSKSQEDIYAEESIYTKFTSNKDTALFPTWHAAPWKEKLNLLDKFDDDRLVGFGKKIIFQEAPEVLPETMYKSIRREIAKRILSERKEKWWTIPTLYNEIDTLREKYTNENDNEKLALLDEFNTYAMSIQKKYENV